MNYIPGSLIKIKNYSHRAFHRIFLESHSGGCLAITKGALNSVLEKCGMAEAEKGELIPLAK